MDKTLKDPIVFSIKGSKSKNKFKGTGKLSSQFGTIKSKGFMEVPLDSKSKKKAPVLSTKITTSYDLPIVKDRMLRKNLVVLSAKMHDRSSKSLMKYDGSVTLESRKYQKASFVAGMSLSHKASFTKSVITYKSGAKSKNLKDMSKELKVETTLDHKIGKKDVEIKYDVQILYPFKAIEWQLNGKHEHHLNKKIAIETYNSFIYAKGKSSEFRFKVDDNSKKLKQYNGLLEFNYPDIHLDGKRINGRSYRLASTLEQTSSKEFSQSLQVTINRDLAHTMYTKIKYLKNTDYELSSQIDIGSNADTKITILSNHLNDKREASVKVNKAGKVYEGTISTTVNRKEYSNRWDVSWPERRVKGLWDMSKEKDSGYTMKFSTNWDANKDDTKKIDAEFTFGHMEKPKSSKFELDMSVNTPFENYEAFAYKRLIEVNPRGKKDEFKVVWQRPENELSYKVWVLSPLSLNRFQMDFEIVTPFEELRMYRSEIRHKFASPNYLSTSIVSKYNENDVSADILVSSRKNEVQNKQECNLELNFVGAKRNTLEMKIGDFNDIASFNPLTPSIPKTFKFKLGHESDGRVYNSEISLKRDGLQSKIDNQLTYTRVGKIVNLNSEMNIILDDVLTEPVHLKLSHANTLTNLNTTVTTTWGKAKRANLDVGMTFLDHDQSLYVHYSGTTESVHDLIYKIHHNTINGWKGSSFMQVNKDIRLKASSKYSITKTELTLETFGSTSKTILNAEYANYPFTGYMKYSFKDPKDRNWHDIVLDGSVVKNKERDWSSDIKLVTPFEQAKNIAVKGNLKDVGKNTWSLDGGISYDVKKDIKLRASVDVEKFSKIKAELESPWKDVELDITHKQQRKNVKTEMKIKYDDVKPIVAKFNGRMRSPEKYIFSLDLSSPYDQIRSANLKGLLQKAGNKWNGELNMKSSNKKVKSLDLNFSNELREGFFDHTVEITSSAFDKVEARCMMEIQDHENAFEVKLVAPEVGRNLLGFNTRSRSWVDFTQRWYGEIKEQELDMGYSLKHDELATKAWLTFNYPGADKSFVKASVHKTGNYFIDFDIGADLQIGKNTVPYNASAQFSYIEGKTAIGSTFTSPFTEPVSFLLKQEIIETGQTREIYGRYDDEYMVDIYDMYDLADSSYTSKRRTGYLFKGEGHTVGYTLDADWAEDGEEFGLESNYDDYAFSMKGNHVPQDYNSDNQDTVDVYITTPFEDYRNLELHNQFEKNDEYTHSGKIMVVYMEGKEAELTYDVKKMNHKTTANAVLILPVRRYEKNSISFIMIERTNVVTVDAEATMGQGENLKATVELRNKEEFIFDLVGPIKEFKHLKIAGKINENRLNGNIELQLSLHPRPVRLEYDVHLDGEPVVMTFKLRSPYENFKRADLTINHSGAMFAKCTTTSILTSEELGTITFTSDINYDTVTSMEGKVTLTSSLENMENLRLHLKTDSENNKKVNALLEVGWDIDKEIVIKSNYEEAYDKNNEDTMSFNIDMTTPFDEVKVLDIKLSEDLGRNLKRSIFVRHNDRTYLDADFSIKIHRNGAQKYTIEMRNPRPMSVSVEGKLEDKSFEGKVFLNWDKHKPESQFEFNVRVADRSDQSNIDKDFSFKVIHPVRIMAVEYLLRKADNEMQTSGLITWDESKGNTFSYDVGYTDRSSMYSEMYNAHVKVGVPQRSVKVLGSYGDNGSSRTMTGTALWDADRDEKKKVTMSTTHEYSERMERVNLDLNLPSINKQLNVGVSLKRGYGSNILDSKTEISYSSDPRKTIHITNKIYNSVMDSTGNGDYNYTMETGFKHAITETDLQWVSHMSQVSKMVSIGHQFIYLTIDRQQKLFSCRFEMDGDKTGQLMIATPIKSVKFVGERFDQRGRPAFKLDLLEDGRRTLSFAGKLLPRSKQIEVTMHYDRDDPSKTMFVTGAYVADESAELSMFDSENLYAKVNVKMNSSNIIHNRIVWRPTLPKEFQVFMGMKVTAFSYSTKDIWDLMVKNVGTEVKAKYLRVSQELRDEIGQVFALIRTEMEIFNVQLETLRTQIRRIYNRNDLHIQDMGRQMNEALQELLGSIQDLVKNYRSYYNDVSKATNEWINSLKNYPISLMYTQAINDLVEKLEEIRFALEKVLDSAVVELKDVSEKAYRKYTEISREIDRKLNSYIQSSNKLAVFKQLMRQRERLIRMGADSNGLLEKELEPYDEFFMQAQQILEDQFHDLMSRVEFQQLHAMGTEIYQQLKYWNHERGLSHALTRLLDMSKNLILMEIGKIKNILMDIKKSHVIVYDPTKGELEFEIYLPFTMESLSSPPKFKVGQYAKDAYQWVENRFPPIRNSSLWDVYDNYVPSLRPSQWVPPFEATGYVIGSQTILTFDKTEIDFLSTCSHVLVREMLNDSFSVVLNYDRNPVVNGIKSLCFSFGKSLSLEVSKNYQLTVNRQETEMPFENDLVRVERNGDAISVKYINGLEVVTNPRIDLHKVILSGWFHGRTAGLLGFYDNERHNEAAMMDRLHEFEVNRRSCSNQNVAVQPEPSDGIEGTCTELFQDANSQFKSCFKWVKPDAFLRMCQIYMSTMEENDALVKVTQQYRSVCRDQGVFMPPLSGYADVITCNTNGMLDGDDVKNSADVVFVVEDAKCNEWASSSLTDIVTEINKSLMKAGINNNRFGLVGYKGEDVTVRTIHGNHFGKANSFLKAVETLSLDTSEDFGDLVSAVRAAKMYPFRIGVPVKMMVVVPCTSCQASILDWNLSSQLKDAAFQVHVLQESDASSHTDIPRIYGMEMSGSRVVSLAGVPTATLTYDNYCSDMASTTNGSVFDTTHLNQRRGRMQRQFIKSFANKVGTSYSIPECQRCECNPDLDNVECKTCDSPSLSNYFFSESPAMYYYHTRR